MDLSTKYLGLDLRSPLVVSASPLSHKIDNIKRMEEYGASAVVLHSLFEEQIRQEERELAKYTEEGTNSFAEASSFFPEQTSFVLGPQEYLTHIKKAKEAVKIPIIASLNGSTPGGWTDYAKQIEQAGADALELNIYNIPTDLALSAEQLEHEYLNIVKSVREAVKMPVAVKLSPFFSNMANMAKRLDDLGTDGLVMFNRFYQPDIDFEELVVQPSVTLSTQFASRLPLRWIAILSGRIKADLAATSGIHQTDDVIKMLLVGAKVTMLCSSLYINGIAHLREVASGLSKWLETHEYESLKDMQGAMCQNKVANPTAYERAQYMKTLQSEVQ